jgi:MFS family permease
MNAWRVMLVLAAAQFVMVLDTTVMSVSISNVVEDLDTTVAGVQLAITVYTLVMAALMLTGGKIGDITGRRRAFAIGLSKTRHLPAKPDAMPEEARAGPGPADAEEALSHS